MSILSLATTFLLATLAAAAPATDNTAAAKRQIINHTGRATLSQAGLSYCGKTYGPDDYVISVPAKYWDTATYDPCETPVTIDAKNLALSVYVVDQCDDCADDDILVNRRVYDYFGFDDPNVDWFDCLWYDNNF